MAGEWSMRLLRHAAFCLLVLQQAVGLAQAQAPAQHAPHATPCIAATDYKDHLSALLIGVDDYAGSGISDLVNAGNDAARMAKVLSEQGFTVRCLKDISRNQIMEEFAKLRDHMSQFLAAPENANDNRNRLAVVFFAGHGFSTATDNFILGKPQSGETSPVQFRLGFSHIADAFESIKGKGYPLLFILDACRTESSTGGAGTHPAFSAHLLSTKPLPGMVIHSTLAGGTAIDQNIAIGAEQNGLFVSRFAALLRYTTMTIDSSYILTKRALQSLSHRNVKQTPYNLNTEYFAMKSTWRKSSIPASACDEDLEGFLLASFSTCQSDNTRDSPCAKNICNYKRSKTAAYSPAAKQACLGAMLSYLVMDIDELCAQPENQQPPELVSRIMEESHSLIMAEAIASLEHNSRHSRQRVNDVEVIVTQDFNSLAANRRKAETQKARDTLFANSRIINSRIAGPVDIVIPQGSDVKLRDTPNATSTIMRTLPPGTRVVVDCQNIQCTPEWTGVRVQADNEIYRGWLDKREVLALTLTQERPPVVDLAYESTSLYPSRASLETLKINLETANKRSTVSAKILVYQNGARIEDETRAEARLAVLSRTLREAGVIAENIVPVIHVTNEIDARERATVRVLALP